MNELVYLIHGFNVKDSGKSTTDSIKPYMEELGFIVRELDYGYFHRVRVRLCNESVARMIAELVKPGSACIAHSNGGALVYLACEFGAPFEYVSLVNPALDSKLAISKKYVKHVDVWYSPRDPWVNLAQYIPWSIWGAQGKTGYTGKYDHRYRQYNEDLILPTTDKNSHSQIWKSHEARKVYADITAKTIRGQ